MILIISENSDFNTDIVLDWLSYKNIPFVRINNTDLFTIENIVITNKKNVSILLSSEKITFNVNNVAVYWHRRGELSISRGLNSRVIQSNRLTGIHRYLNLEFRYLKKFVLDSLYSRIGIGKIDDNFTNKLSNLMFAKQFGLLIPDTYILRTKIEIIELLKKGEFITKGIHSGYYSIDGIEYSLFTSEVLKIDLEKLPDKFDYSFIQTKLNKRYELRIFYFNESMFTTAIFSQNDSQTSIDFRHYNNSKPNRTPPYKLPNEIRLKIIAFMNFKKMKTGSIDIVVNEDKDYIFLEVNPFGQFNQVSKPGNFYIEKHISEYLILNYINGKQN